MVFRVVGPKNRNCQEEAICKLGSEISELEVMCPGIIAWVVNNTQTNSL